MNKTDPNGSIVSGLEMPEVPGVPLDEEAANDPGLDLGKILVVDPRILIADTDAATELARQMGEALDQLTVAEWLLLGEAVEENAA